MSSDIVLGDKLRKLTRENGLAKIEKEFDDVIVPLLIIQAEHGNYSLTLNNTTSLDLLKKMEHHLDVIAAKHHIRYTRINVALKPGETCIEQSGFGGAIFSWK